MTIMDPLQIKMGSLMLLTICACCTNVISLELMIR